jgi:hypothetical protein
MLLLMSCSVLLVAFSALLDVRYDYIFFRIGSVSRAKTV